MSMTQKQAREYIANDSGNWKLVETTEAPHTTGHVRVYVLKFKNITFVRLDVLTIAPLWTRRKGEPVTDDWHTALYYTTEGEEDQKHLVYPVRPTEMAREIWERSKAADAETKDS